MTRYLLLWQCGLTWLCKSKRDTHCSWTTRVIHTFDSRSLTTNFFKETELTTLFSPSLQTARIVTAVQLTLPLEYGVQKTVFDVCM